MKNRLWFRRKTYGWGWTPNTWEGWLVTGIFVAIPLSIKFLTRALELSKNEQNFYVFATLPLVVTGLILVCLRYGEKPRWQWGIKITKLALVEILVNNYGQGVNFYNLILLPLGWTVLSSDQEATVYSDGAIKFIIKPFANSKNLPSLNHLAFHAQTKELVDEFYNVVLLKNQIKAGPPTGDNKDYSVKFFDHDNMMLELIYSEKTL